MRTVSVPPSPRIKYAISRTGYDWLQALLEIIDNSADAVKKKQEADPSFKGEIHISTVGYTNDGSRVICITDNGVGVDTSQDPDEIGNVWGLGGSGKDGKESQYGVFGMGLKGAVLAISESATFTSRASSAEDFQTSLYRVEDESFDIPIFNTQSEMPNELETKLIEGLPDSGSVVVLRDVKAGPSRVEHIYDGLQKHLGRIYKEDLESGKYIIKLGNRTSRTLNESSGVDPLDGGDITNWLIGGPNGKHEEVEFDGHKFRIQLSHTRMLGTKTNSNLGSGIKGSRKRGAYYTRKGREIAIETTEGKLPWSGMVHISNFFLKIDFDDDGINDFPIETDFGKKGVNQSDEFLDFMTKYLEHHVATVKAQTKTKEVSASQEETQNKVGAVFSSMIRSARSQPQSTTTSKKGKRSSPESRPSIARQRYVGKTKRIDIDNGYGIKSVFEFRHVEKYEARDLPFWLEAGEKNGHWVVVLNEANAFVSDSMSANNLENLYMIATSFVLANREVIGDEKKIIEATEYFGQLANEYSVASATLAKQGILEAS